MADTKIIEAEPHLSLMGVEIPDKFMNPEAPGEVLFCVIDGKTAREASEKEYEVIRWCFGKHDTPEIGAIGYAVFEREPIMREWIEKATPYYLRNIKRKYRKWKRKKTLWVKELESLS